MVIRNYLEIGLLESSHWSNVGALKEVWSAATIQRMMICCMQLKMPHLATILSQFSKEVDYGRALVAMEAAVQLELFKEEHMRLVWDTALQELLVGVFKKRGNQPNMAFMVSFCPSLLIHSRPWGDTMHGLSFSSVFFFFFFSCK